VNTGGGNFKMKNNKSHRAERFHARVIKIQINAKRRKWIKTVRNISF